MVENIKDIYNAWNNIDEKTDGKINEAQVQDAFQKYRRTAEKYGEESDEAKTEHSNWMKIKKELAVQEGWDKSTNNTENEDEPEFIDIEKEDLNIKEEPEFIDIEKRGAKTEHEPSKELLEKLKGDFNLNKEEIEMIKGFNNLSEGQQFLILENLKQLKLGRIQEEAVGEYSKNISSEKKYLKKIWQGISKKYQIAKLEKSTAEKIDKGGIEVHGESLQQLVDGMNNYGPDVEIVDGKLQIQYAATNNIENSEHVKTIDNFNKIASEFSQTPYEWSLGTANRKEKARYQDIKKRYMQARDKMLIEKNKEQGGENACLDVNEIENQIRMNQFLNSNPEVEKELDIIEDKSVWKKAIAQVATERGIYAAGGYLTRAATVSILGAIGAPVAAGLFGGWRARMRAKENLKDKEIASRRGIKDTSNTAKKFSEVEKVSAKMEKQMTKMNDENLTGKQRAAYKKALQTNIDWIEDKIDKGLIDFGQNDNRISNQYNVIQSLSKGKIELEGYKLKEKYLDRFEIAVSERDTTAEKAKSKHLRAQFAKGAFISAGFAGAGYGIRYAGEHLGWWGKAGAREAIEQRNQGAIDYDDVRHRGPEGAIADTDSDQPGTEFKKVADIPNPEEFEKQLDKEPGGEKPFRGAEREISEAEKDAFKQREFGDMDRGSSSKDFRDAMDDKNYDQGMDRRASRIDFAEAEKAVGIENTESHLRASDMPDKEIMGWATVKQGEGVSHSIMRQLAGGDPRSAGYTPNEGHLREMGYKGDIHNRGEIESWSRNLSGKIVSQEEYFDKAGNKQTWVMQPNKSAYVLHGNAKEGFHIAEYHDRDGSGDFRLRELELDKTDIVKGYEDTHEIKSPVQQRGEIIHSRIDEAEKVVSGKDYHQAAVDSWAKDTFGKQAYEWDGSDGQAGMSGLAVSELEQGHFGDPHSGAMSAYYENDPQTVGNKNVPDIQELAHRTAVLEKITEIKENMGPPSKGETAGDYFKRYEQFSEEQSLYDHPDHGPSDVMEATPGAAEQDMALVASKNDWVVIDPDKNILSVYDKTGSSSREFTLPKGITVTEQVQQNPKNLFVDIKYGDNHVLSGKLFFTKTEGGILKLDAGTKTVDIKEFFDRLGKSSEPGKVIGDYATDTESHFGAGEASGKKSTLDIRELEKQEELKKIDSPEERLIKIDGSEERLKKIDNSEERIKKIDGSEERLKKIDNSEERIKKIG